MSKNYAADKVVKPNTFTVVQISPKETIRYEIPNALRWIFDEWRSSINLLVVDTPRGTKLRSRTIQQIIDLKRSECPELFDQIKITKKPIELKLRGYKGDARGVNK